jgi:2',3'-cyclic-nucleotide 2'-phosphodiesterase (5'-nucleotidase family)
MLRILAFAVACLALPTQKCHVPVEQITNPVYSDSPSKSPVNPDIPSKSPVNPDIPSKSPVYPDTPSKSPVYPDTPSKSPVNPDIPSKSPVNPDTPSKSPVNPDTPSSAPATTSKSSEAPVSTSTPGVNVVNKLTLLHTNDVHAHLEEFNRGGTACRPADIANNVCYGGAARIKTKVDEFRTKTQDMLLLDAGDQFQGTLFHTLLGGAVSAEAMNDIGYESMAIGNHEFDDGVDVLGQFIKNLTFPVLSSNIDLESSPVLKNAGVKPYVVFPKYKLGVVGYITPTIPDIVSKDGLKGTKFLHPIESIQKAVDELHAQGIKRIICLSHNGYGPDQELAAKTKGIQVIVGGHSHTLLLNNATLGPAGPYPTEIKGLDQSTTYIVQAHRFGNYLGHLELEWNEEDKLISLTGDPILLDQQVPKETKLQSKVIEWSKVFESLAKDVLTTATDDFPNSCRGRECAIANLITDCMMSEHKEKGLNANVAVTNAGGIRAALSRGPVTASDMYTISPFGNAIVQFKWTGAQIMDVLERVANGQNKAGARLISQPHFSGLRYTFNNGTTKAITDVTIGGTPLSLETTYEILSVDFVAGGGDNIMDSVEYIPGDLLAEQLTRCLRRKESITPTIDGRFTVTRN